MAGTSLPFFVFDHHKDTITFLNRLLPKNLNDSTLNCFADKQAGSISAWLLQCESVILLTGRDFDPGKWLVYTMPYFLIPALFDISSSGIAIILPTGSFPL